MKVNMLLIEYTDPFMDISMSLILCITAANPLLVFISVADGAIGGGGAIGLQAVQSVWRVHHVALPVHRGAIQEVPRIPAGVPRTHPTSI